MDPEYKDGSIWINTEITKWGYPVYIKNDGLWKFWGYSQSQRYPCEIKRSFLNKPHKRDCPINEFDDETHPYIRG